MPPMPPFRSLASKGESVGRHFASFMAHTSHPTVFQWTELSKNENDFDSLIVISSAFADAELPELFEGKIKDVLVQAKKADNTIATGCVFLITPNAPGHRLVTSATGALNTDWSEVRLVADAAKKAVLRARDAGSIRPAILVSNALPTSEDYAHATEVAVLAALQATYVALQAREAKPELEVIKAIGFVPRKGEDGAKLAKQLNAIEAGKRLARDVGGPDCERMTPYRCADYLVEAFKNVPNVKLSLKKDTAELGEQYPLLMAVARASLQVPRHHPVVVRLEYQGEGAVDQTLLFAGKGLTYDTGGADLKVGGIMPGMSRDKCGAANVAGFVRTVSLLSPKGLRVVAELGFTRNSVGADAYVADEVVKSHAGIRVHVGNTDAEGRLVLADCLSHMRELAKSAVNPQLFTVATLTGHVGRCYGFYPAALDNGPAATARTAHQLQAIGGVYGDPFEVSILRRDDVKAVAAKNASHDVLQVGDTQPAGARAHQYAAVFIQTASGLKAHGKDSSQPLAYTHLDIAGAACDDQSYQFGTPTATPLVALTARYVLGRL